MSLTIKDVPLTLHIIYVTLTVVLEPLDVASSPTESTIFLLIP